jgi:hypothetical protein
VEPTREARFDCIVNDNGRKPLMTTSSLLVGPVKQEIFGGFSDDPSFHSEENLGCNAPFKSNESFPDLDESSPKQHYTKPDQQMKGQSPVRRHNQK